MIHNGVKGSDKHSGGLRPKTQQRPLAQEPVNGFVIVDIDGITFSS